MEPESKYYRVLLSKPTTEELGRWMERLEKKR